MNEYLILMKVFLILFSNSKQMISKADCGLPAIPDSTKLSIFRSRYEEETTVTYECEAKNSELIEGVNRKCINHKWNGSLPRCAIEVKKVILQGIKIEGSGKHLRIYRQIFPRSMNRKSYYKSKVQNEEKYFECTKIKCLWNVFGSQTWIFQLTRGYSFNYFILYMKGGSLLENKNNYNLTFKASIEDIVSSKSCEIEQFRLIDDAFTYKIGFSCNLIQHSGAIHEGIDESIQEIIIKVEATQRINLTTTFCALKVFTISDSCGSPEKPLNSHLLAQEKTYSVFACREGYSLVGVQKVKCGPNGKWMDQFPLCKPMKTCRIPAIDREDPNLHVEYKHFYKVNGTLYGEPDDEAIYACINITNGTSMQFKGETSRICKDGMWSGSQPTCNHLTNMTPIEMSFHFNTPEMIPEMTPEMTPKYSKSKSMTKIVVVIMAMLGSFTVGGISVTVVIYLIVKKKRDCNKRPKISIFIDESDDIEYDKPQEYSSVRVSQCSNFSNEIVNPLYEDLKSIQSLSP